MYFAVNMVLCTRSIHQISFIRYSMCVLYVTAVLFFFIWAWGLSPCSCGCPPSHVYKIGNCGLQIHTKRDKRNNNISITYSSVSPYAINSTHCHLVYCFNSCCSYHKHSPGCSSGFTVGHPFTHRLVVKWLLAVVEGIVVESVHQVGINVTEEHAHL